MRLYWCSEGQALAPNRRVLMPLLLRYDDLVKLRQVDRDRIPEPYHPLRLTTSGALLAVWTTDWDGPPGEWWYTCCDRALTVEALPSANVRRDVRSGLRKCAVRRVDPWEFGSRAYLVLATALTSNGERPPYCWNDWERALRNEKAPRGGDDIVPATFLAAAANSSGAFYTLRLGELTAVQEAASELEELVLAKLPDQPATLRELRNLVKDIAVLIGQYTPAPVIGSGTEPCSDSGADGHSS